VKKTLLLLAAAVLALCTAIPQQAVAGGNPVCPVDGACVAVK